MAGSFARLRRRRPACRPRSTRRATSVCLDRRRIASSEPAARAWAVPSSPRGSGGKRQSFSRSYGARASR
eukprot:4885658-Alexandrium_andersonii.AAC.1